MRQKRQISHAKEIKSVPLYLGSSSMDCAQSPPFKEYTVRIRRGKTECSIATEPITIWTKRLRSTLTVTRYVDSTYHLWYNVMKMVLHLYGLTHSPSLIGGKTSNILQSIWLCMCAKSLQSHSTLCNPTDCSPPGSSVHRILQVRMLEWVAMPSSRGSSWRRDQIHVSNMSCIRRQVLYH